MIIPRSEYPRPQFEREEWLNLNGKWSYILDQGVSGSDRGRELYNSQGFNEEIIVPFCPESKLSGVAHTDFINQIWYHRTITIPREWQGKSIYINCGGIDYESEIYIDGKSVGIHFGGSCSFSYDISQDVEIGKKHHLVIRAKDQNKGVNQPYGKQSDRYQSHGCSYTRTTGIWQTVWLEGVAEEGLKRCTIISDYDNDAFIFKPEFYQNSQAIELKTTIKLANGEGASKSLKIANGIAYSIELKEAESWSPESPFLYDIIFEVIKEGKVIDCVKAYAGMRKVHIEGHKIFLNNQEIYQRLVLDQGFYPDGIWTAPSDLDLKKDIELAMQAGFNGARLHQKVFEERFHYWADKLGYLTWGEYVSWGCDVNTVKGERDAVTEFREILERDINHPSIITWTPLNETWNVSDKQQHCRSHISLYDLCHAIDPTRPVNDSSGGLHYKTDIWTVHNYEAKKEDLIAILRPKEEGRVWSNYENQQEHKYAGQPYLLDEFGGIKWISDIENGKELNHQKSWGYGEEPKTIEEFYQRLSGQIEAILSLDHIVGFCYTQLTDVEQEKNGIYYYDRSTKFDMNRIKKIFTKKR